MEPKLSIMEQTIKQLRKLISTQTNRSLFLFGALLLIIFSMKSRKRNKKRHNGKAWNWKLLNKMIKENNISAPSMFIDLDVFEQNVLKLANLANKYNKTLRMATKSIRCPHLITHAMKISNGTLKGIFIFIFFFPEFYEYIIIYNI